MRRNRSTLPKDIGGSHEFGSLADGTVEIIAGTRRIARLFWFAIALAALTAACAAFCARDLFYDGAFYLLGWAVDGRFRFFVPVRESVQALQQVFPVAGERAGIKDVFVLARLFSFGASGWPVLLTVACWPVLPRKEKSWIIGPLLNLIAVIPTTSMFGIGEGILASCLLWLTFLMFAFRTQTWSGAGVTLALTAACGMTHEVAFPFLAGLAFLALNRARQAHGRHRVVLMLIALVATAGSLHLLYWVLFPRDAHERSNFFTSLLGGFVGSGRAPNIPALASIVAAASIVLVLARPKRSITASWPVWFAGLVFTVELGVALIIPDQVLTPASYFAARGLPVLFTTVGAFGMIFLRERQISPARFATRAVMTILVGLLLVQTAFQLAITERWWVLTGDMRNLLSASTGIIPFAASSRVLNPSGSRFRWDILESWSVEPLSIVLAPGGRVRAVLQARPHEPWVPYHFDSAGSLPRAPGLDWSNFPVPSR